MILKIKHLPLILVGLALAIASCSTSSATEPSDSQSSQMEPTDQADDTLSPGNGQDTPTDVSEVPYSGHGETLAVVQSIMDGPHRVLFIDPTGLGSHEVVLPNDALLTFPPGVGLSADGRYYAYYTGTLDASNLTLVIFSLAEERILMEIKLLSDDYPANFQQLADEFVDSGAVPAELAWFDEADFAYQLQGAFEYGIDSMAWSPQGRYLAFSGQMEGPSSDLYVLDTQTMDVSRLTSGPGMMQRLSWSPDGHWIMHASAYVVSAGSRVTNHAAARDGSDVVSFPADTGLQEGVWLTNNLYTVNDADNGPGSYNLAVLDARTGSMTTLFEGAFRSYAYDPNSNTILLQSEPFFDSDPERGLYLIQASEPYPVTRLSAPTFSTIIPIGSDAYPFSGFLEDNGLALIGLDGSVRTIDELSWYPYPAPTEDLLALRYFPRAYGLWIYDIDREQRIDVLSEGSIFRLTWSPDSSALFYVADRQLHSFMPGSGENVLLYTWPANSMSDIDLKWVIVPE